jgi:hypothetical protein
MVESMDFCDVELRAIELFLEKRHLATVAEIAKGVGTEINMVHCCLDFLIKKECVAGTMDRP